MRGALPIAFFFLKCVPEFSRGKHFGSKRLAACRNTWGSRVEDLCASGPPYPVGLGNSISDWRVFFVWRRIGLTDPN